MTWGSDNQWGQDTTTDWKGKTATWNGGGGNKWDNKPAEKSWEADGQNGYADPLAEKISLVQSYVSGVVADANKWDERESLKSLLHFAVENALPRPKSVRHSVQAELATIIKDGISHYKDTLETRVVEAKELYDQFEKDCETAPARNEKLTTELSSLEESKVEADTKIQQEYEQMMALKKEEDNAREEVQAVQRRLKEVNDKITRTDHIYEREFLPMKKDYRAHGRLEKIVQQLEKLGAEEVLLKCIDVSLRGAERGKLATSAIAMAEEVFTEKLNELREEASNIESSDLPKSKRHVEAATAAIEQAREKVNVANKKGAEIAEKMETLLKQKERSQLCIDDPHSYQQTLRDDLEAAEKAVTDFTECETAVEYIEVHGVE